MLHPHPNYLSVSQSEADRPSQLLLFELFAVKLKLLILRASLFLLTL
jgi:hypothetical protein